MSSRTYTRALLPSFVVAHLALDTRFLALATDFVYRAFPIGRFPFFFGKVLFPLSCNWSFLICGCRIFCSHCFSRMLLTLSDTNFQFFPALRKFFPGAQCTIKYFSIAGSSHLAAPTYFSWKVCHLSLQDFPSIFKDVLLPKNVILRFK